MWDLHGMIDTMSLNKYQRMSWWVGHSNLLTRIFRMDLNVCFTCICDDARVKVTVLHQHTPFDNKFIELLWQRELQELFSFQLHPVHLSHPFYPSLGLALRVSFSVPGSNPCPRIKPGLWQWEHGILHLAHQEATKHTIVIYQKNKNINK